MKNYENEMLQVLSVLKESGALPHCVISGSWAMYFYKYVFDNFVPQAETTDLDIFLPDPKKANATNLIGKMRDINYILNSDYMTGKTMFLSDNGFSIEFLTIPNRTMASTIAVPGFSIVAEALPKMAPAGWNYIQIDFNGILVNVVSPVSFVLQKLLINKERKPDFKKEKDIDAVKYVLQFVKISNKYNEELVQSLNEYPKKWKKAIEETAKLNNIKL